MSEAAQPEEALFEVALKLPASERAAFLDQTCAGDADLRRRVEVLLGAFERAGGFMKEPATPERTQRFSLPSTEKPGDKIGRYKLLEQIGEGGCGVVYVAEQEEPVRRCVALKVIKLGMDTRQVIARFDAERQALAMMDHPNIAKVLDAGATETGRPYFVMELVRGIKITDYCEQHHLSPRARLDLFTQVCRAIQHAHQKGVIHRDIKPSNILVTLHDGAPVPKVIDFGIAKATQGRLTDQTVYTAFEQFIGTPAYMSPEQAEMSGLDIDTRSDIYSLGVLLYELLTGKTPFDAKELLAAGLDEMRRTIREVEPVKPSTRLTQELNSKSKTRNPKSEMESALPTPHSAFPSDLDWIVMKCLEKDRTRRYETANGLATDIGRHLSNEPIDARPPSRLYRFQKSVQRNKLAFAAATAVALALVIGLAVSTAMFFRAQAEKKKAQTEAAKSQQVAQFLKDMLRGVAPSRARGRDTAMLQEIADKTAERIDTDLKNQPAVEIELRLILADVYSELSLLKKSEQMARETLQLARARFGEEDLTVADALSRLGGVLIQLHAIDEAGVVFRQSIVLQRKLRGVDSLEEAVALCGLGHVLRHQAHLLGGEFYPSKLKQAEDVIRSGLAIQRKRLGNENEKVARTLDALNIVLENEGKLAEAEAVIGECLAINLKLLGEDHPETASARERLGVTLLSMSTNRIAEAETNFRKALEVQERTAGKGKLRQLYTHDSLAKALQQQGKLDEAEIHAREALAIAQNQLGSDNPDLARLLYRLAGILQAQGKLAEARPLAEEAFGICQRDSARIARSTQDHCFESLKDILTDLGDTNALENLKAIRQPDTKPNAAPTAVPPLK